MSEHASLVPDSPSLRPIHYMGNKSRFLQHIDAAVGELARPRDPGLDLFAGSGVVSRRLAHTRPVIACDIQAYSSVLVNALSRPTVPKPSDFGHISGVGNSAMGELPPAARALVALEDEALHDQDWEALADILEEGSLVAGRPESSRFADLHDAARAEVRIGGSIGTLLRYYGGVYFSYRQAAELDALAEKIREMPEPVRATALAALLGTASDIVSSVGSHFAQPLRPRDAQGRLKAGWGQRLVKARSRSTTELWGTWVGRYGSIQPTQFGCSTLQGDFRHVLNQLDPGEVGVVYADPPYTRDHYSRFYHVLETLAVGDDPGVSDNPSGVGSQPSRGLYRVDRHQSPFSIRSQVTPAFVELFSHCKRLGAPLVLSYSPSGVGTAARPQPRLLTVPEIVRIAGDYFGEISVQSTGQIAHSKFNRQALNGQVDYDAEILILARP